MSKWCWAVAGLIVVIAWLPGFGLAQVVPEGGSKSPLRWFAGLGGEKMVVGEFHASLLGGQAGIHLTDSWYAGIEGYTTVVSGEIVEAHPAWGPPAAWEKEWTFDRTGVLLGFRFPHDKGVQFTPEIAAGIGRLKREAVYPDVYEEFFGQPYESDPEDYTWMQVRLGASVPLTNWLQAAAHMGFHIPFAININGLKENDFHGGTVQFSLRFGSFPNAG